MSLDEDDYLRIQAFKLLDAGQSIAVVSAKLRIAATLVRNWSENRDEIMASIRKGKKPVKRGRGRPRNKNNKTNIEVSPPPSPRQTRSKTPSLERAELSSESTPPPSPRMTRSKTPVLTSNAATSSSESESPCKAVSPPTPAVTRSKAPMQLRSKSPCFKRVIHHGLTPKKRKRSKSSCGGRSRSPFVRSNSAPPPTVNLLPAVNPAPAANMSPTVSMSRVNGSNRSCAGNNMSRVNELNRNFSDINIVERVIYKLNDTGARDPLTTRTVYEQRFRPQTPNDSRPVTPNNLRPVTPNNPRPVTPNNPRRTPTIINNIPFVELSDSDTSQVNNNINPVNPTRDTASICASSSRSMPVDMDTVQTDAVNDTDHDSDDMDTDIVYQDTSICSSPSRSVSIHMGSGSSAEESEDEQESNDEQESDDDDQNQAPKDNVGAGETAWPAQNNVASPGPSRKPDNMQPRASTSRKPDSMQRPSTSTSAGYMKSDPVTPPHTLQPPPMIMHHSFMDTSQSQPQPQIMQPQQPRLLPKPMGLSQQQQQQQQHQSRQRVRPQPPPQPSPEPDFVLIHWNNYHSNFKTIFPNLLNREKFVDVTLACEGRSIKCHKIVLSSCSSYLETLLSENPCKHPIIMMPSDIKYWQIRAIIDFMYFGEVNVERNQLSEIIAAANALQIKGLANDDNSTLLNEEEELQQQEDRPQSPRAKRKRTVSPQPTVRQQPPPTLHQAPPPVHHMPVSPPHTMSPTLLPNSSVSIQRLSRRQPVMMQPLGSGSPPSHMEMRANSPGIEITPVVPSLGSFEMRSIQDIKSEPIDISDSNDGSMDQLEQHQDYDMDKDYALDEENNLESGGEEDDDDGGGGDDPSLPSTSSHADPGTHNGNDDDITDTPDLDHQGNDIDTPDFPENGADLGLNMEEENPPDLADEFDEDELNLSSEPPDETNPIDETST